MNIVEAFIKFNGELIIIISGLSGSNKTKLSDEISRDFKIKKIDIEMFCISENKNKISLDNGISIIDWDNIESFDWDKINTEIIKYKNTGVVVCGPYFPTNKLKFKPNFHIHIKIPKQQLIETRKKFIKDNPDKCPELQSIDIENLINKITYPYYLKYLEQSKIDKYINTKEISREEIYDKTAEFLFFKIKEWLSEYNKKEKVEKKKKNLDDSSSSSSSSNDKSIYIGTNCDNINYI